MPQDWSVLTKLAAGETVAVERVRLTGSGVAIEGSFELPPLARLSPEDQVFVAAFVRAHGSIKEMETLFGVSYPTIKNRLNRLADALDVVKVAPAPPSRREVLDRLERGELTVDEAVAQLKSEGVGHD